MYELRFQLGCHALDAAGELAADYGQTLTEAGYELTASGPNGVRWERSKTPGWAVALAVLLFPIGLLFLLTKDETAVTMRVVPTSSGCEVHVTTSGNVPEHLLCNELPLRPDPGVSAPVSAIAAG